MRPRPSKQARSIRKPRKRITFRAQSAIAKKQNKPSGWMDRNVLLASAIAALAGLLGAMIGFAGSYVAAREQFSQQVIVKAREENVAACTVALKSLWKLVNELQMLQGFVAIDLSVDKGLSKAYADAVNRSMKTATGLGDAISPLLIAGSDDAVRIVEQFSVDATKAIKEIPLSAKFLDGQISVNDQNNFYDAVNSLKQTYGRLSSVCRRDAQIIK